MKPFVINRNSWHYNLNCKFFNASWHMSQWEANHNNFCAYWRATVLRIIFATVAMVFTVSVLLLFAIKSYQYPLDTLLVIGGSILVIFVIFGIPAMLIAAYNYVTKSKAINQSIVVQRIRNHKDKICPQVDYK